jgi:type II secretory pathway component PulK
VTGRALLGVIISGYDSEPYAHMVPIASIFSAIESVPLSGNEETNVRVAAQVLLEATPRKAADFRPQLFGGAFWLFGRVFPR